MKTKSFFLVAFAFMAAMVLYFGMHPSYEKSLEAKFYYETGEYKLAYSLAKEAFALDPYNKMAATIMAQSQYSLRYANYIDDARRYIMEIEKLVKKGDIDEAKRAKIRTIADIMIKAYDKLAPSVVVDKELIKEAKEYHEKFEQLLQKAHRR